MKSLPYVSNLGWDLVRIVIAGLVVLGFLVCLWSGR